MKWLLILAPIAVALIVAVGTALLIGAFIPRTHTATRSARFRAPPERVWAVITNFADHPSWRGLKAIERLPDRNGHPVWKETSGWGDEIPIEIEAIDPPRMMRGRIIDEKLPFGGTWTYELSAEDGGSLLRITEDGFIKPAMFRYIARVIGYAATMEKYLKALGSRLGEQARIEP